MINKKNKSEERTKDPFKDNEANFLESCAIQSELFELESLKKFIFEEI